MKIKNLLKDEDAVSPVIGVILMVAITVILAAVIGAFVLGIGSSQEKTPQVSFGTSYSADVTGGNSNGFEDSSVTPVDSGDEFSIKHDGGGDLQVDRLTLTISTTSAYTSDTEITDLTDGSDTNVKTAWPSTASAGDTVVLTEDKDNEFVSGQEWTLTWKSSSGDSSQILQSGTFP